MERYIPYLTAEARRLEKAGADFIAAPCNSLHVFKQIQDSCPGPREEHRGRYDELSPRQYEESWHCLNFSNDQK